jgi:Ca2+-binding EF-hand superfamily protein
MSRHCKASLFLLFLNIRFAACEESADTESMAVAMMDGFDTNKDGKISMAELLEHVGGDDHSDFKGWEDGFKEADVDRDEHLTTEELKGLLEHVNAPEKEKLVDEGEFSIAKTVMDGFDKDKDGKLTLQELIDHVGDNKEVHATFQGWQDGFKEADKDQDGHLTNEELASLLKEHVPWAHQHELVHESEASTAATILDGFDTDKDGKISLQELLDHVGDNKEVHAAFAGWQDGFTEADKDQDGHLNADELTDLIAHISREDQHELVHESEASTALTILDGFDTDKDGKISMKELLDHVGDKADAHAAFDGWQDGFKEADADGDGHLNADELTSLISHISREDQQNLVHESEESTAATILDGFDTNKDGKISLQELLDHVGDNKEVHAAFQGWQDGFKEADHDGDGHLTADELTDLIAHVSREDQLEMVRGSEASTAATILDGFDTNKDGSISLQELLDHVGDPKDLHAAFHGWEDGFKEADKDNNGLLNVGELTELLLQVSRESEHDMVRESEESTAGTILDGFDKDKDGQISLQELLDHVGDNQEVHAAFQGWQDGFKEADTDNNGFLNVEELTNLIALVSRDDQRELVHDSEASQAAQVLQGFDIDKDGRISMNELIDHVGGNENVNAQFKGWEAGFKEADHDNDGYLTEDELTSLIAQVSRSDQQNLVKESEELAASMLGGLDTDRDGKISMAELEAKMGDKKGKADVLFKGWQAGFKEADADSDGYLSQEELASFYEKLSAPKHDEM